MVIAFANNQAMTAIHGTASVIYTDPVPLNGMDRATAVFDIHYLWKSLGASVSIAYAAEYSNDGTNWLAISSLADSRTAADLSAKTDISVYGAFIRLKFTLTVLGSPGDLAGAGFDLHVSFDKA